MTPEAATEAYRSVVHPDELTLVVVGDADRLADRCAPPASPISKSGRQTSKTRSRNPPPAAPTYKLPTSHAAWDIHGVHSLHAMYSGSIPRSGMFTARDPLRAAQRRNRESLAAARAAGPSYKGEEEQRTRSGLGWAWRSPSLARIAPAMGGWLSRPSPLASEPTVM